MRLSDFLLSHQKKHDLFFADPRSWNAKQQIVLRSLAFPDD